jgi:hypothetical protein
MYRIYQTPGITEVPVANLLHYKTDSSFRTLANIHIMVAVEGLGQTNVPTICITIPMFIKVIDGLPDTRR